MQQSYFLFFATASFLVSSLPAVSAPNTQSSTYENCKRVSPAVVTIYAGTEIGSGSIISTDGTIITNHHVLEEVIQSKGKKLIYVTLPNGGHYTAQLLSTDVPNDLALVKLNTQDTFPIVPLAETVAIQPKEPVCAIGSPLGKRGVLSQGKFGGYRQNGDLKSAIYLYPGNSGGPLLNPAGEMIGVNKSIWESSRGKNTGISFATSVTIARQFIAKTGVNLPTAQTATQPEPVSTELPPPPVTELLPDNMEPAPEFSNSKPVPDPEFSNAEPTPEVPDAAGASDLQSFNQVEVAPDWVTPPFVQSAETSPQEPRSPLRELIFTPSIEPSTAQPESRGMRRLTPVEPISPREESPATRTRAPRSSAAFAGRLGAMIDPQSLVVSRVEYGSPAERAGLQAGDRLVAINGDYLEGYDQLRSLLRQRPRSAVFVIDRNQEFSSLQVDWLSP
jgi:S1-C subfamily serine protease